MLQLLTLSSHIWSPDRAKRAMLTNKSPVQSSLLQILFYISCLEFSFCPLQKKCCFCAPRSSKSSSSAVGSISYRSFHACQLKHYLWVWLGCAAFLQCIFHFHLSLGTTVKSCYLLPIPPLALRQPLTQKHDVLTKIVVNAFLLILQYYSSYSWPFFF